MFKFHGDLKTADDFWRRVNITSSDACWEWKLGCSKQGYGVLIFERKHWRAHRLAYFFHTGIMPKKYVLHSCDNALCVNPSHLREGTQQENMADKIQRGRQAVGEQQGHSKLTTANVLNIRLQLTQGVAKKILARQYRVNPATIRCIASGKTWRHLLV